MIVKKIYQTLCVLFGVVAIWQAITIASGIMTLAHDDRLFKSSQMGNNISFFAIKLLLFGVCLLLSRWFSKLSKRTYENVNVARESLIPDFHLHEANEPSHTDMSQSKGNLTNAITAFVAQVGPILLIVMLITGMIVAVEHCHPEANSQRQLASKDSLTTQMNTPVLDTYPVIPVKNGYTELYSNRKRTNPLIIKTPNENLGFFIKLEDVNTSDSIAAFYLRGGSVFKMEVPEGIYEIKYAYGRTWYGTKYLFGSQTSYVKLDKAFEFRVSQSGVEGYTIELILRENGNLHSREINSEAF